MTNAPNYAAEADELKELISDSETRQTARERCLKLLSERRDAHRIRFLLARSYYLDGYWEFALRELAELRRYLRTPTLDKLITALESATAFTVGEVPQEPKQNSSDEVVAEIDIDADLTDALSEIAKH